MLVFEFNLSATGNTEQRGSIYSTEFNSETPIVSAFRTDTAVTASFRFPADLEELLKLRHLAIVFDHCCCANVPTPRFGAADRGILRAPLAIRRNTF